MHAEDEKAGLRDLLLKEPFHKVQYDVLAYLAVHVKTCVRLYQESVQAKFSLDKSYKGPFSAICQSSGMGKTRLALQLASLEDMHVIYICCRPDKTGYPPTTGVIEPFIRKNGLAGSFWRVLLVAILIEYCEVDHILTNTTVRQEWLQAMVVNSEDGLGFWQKVLARYERLLLESESSTAPLELQLPPSAHFVFVFDEAASLATEQEVTSADGKTSTVSILNRIRKELRVAGEVHKVFGLFMDTNSHVSNLFPPSDSSSYLTPSMRQGDRIIAQPKLVLPPFCMLPMCNPGTTTFMRSNNLHYYPIGRGNANDSGSDMGGVQVSYCPVTLALLSRPLFAMPIHREFRQQSFSVRSQNMALDRIRSFAEDKLLGSISMDVLNPNIVSAETDVARLAVLGCRYFLSTTSTLHKQLLVRQHMATCYGLSDDGKDLVVGYLSEPLLAEAAAELMLKKDAFRTLMEALHRMVVRGSLTLSTGKGEMGELVVCLALSRAFDRACDRLRRAAKADADASSSSSASVAASATTADEPDSVCSTLCRPIPLIEVLVELYGGSTDKTDNVRQQIVTLLKGNALGQGIVFFNHFTKLGDDPIQDVASYKTLLRRGAAVLCRNGETARDIVIPVALPRGSDRAIDLWDRNTYVLTTWEIQVKNWQAAFSLYKLVSLMVETPTTKTVDGGLQESAQQRSFEMTHTGPSLATRNMTKRTFIYPVPILYSAFNTNADHSTHMKKEEMGTSWLFDQHWAMPSLSSSSMASTATEPSTEGATAVATAATAETRSEGGEEGESDRPREAPTTTKHGRPSTPPNGPTESHVDDEGAPTTMPQRATTTHLSFKDVVVRSMNTTPTVPSDDTGEVTKKMQVTGLQLCGLDSFSVFDKDEQDAIRNLLAVSTDVMAHLHDYHEKFLHVTAKDAKQRVAYLRPQYHEDDSC